jgi:hypothetical protein
MYQEQMKMELQGKRVTQDVKLAQPEKPGCASV